MQPKLETFTVDMFRNGARIFVVGPKGCGKTTLCNRLLYTMQSSSWDARSIDTFEYKTFMAVPAVPNQYFILFRGATDFPCGRAIIPETFHSRISLLPAYCSVLYDVDGCMLYEINSDG